MLFCLNSKATPFATTTLFHLTSYSTQEQAVIPFTIAI